MGVRATHGYGQQCVFILQRHPWEGSGDGWVFARWVSGITHPIDTPSHRTSVNSSIRPTFHFLHHHPPFLGRLYALTTHATMYRLQACHDACKSEAEVIFPINCPRNAVHRKLIDDVLALTNRAFEGVRYRSQLGE